MEVVLGKIPPENAVRDAVHVAIIPLVCHYVLKRGQPFKLWPGTKNVATDCDLDDPKCLGIVDPFLQKDGGKYEQGTLYQGERFLGYLKPNTVTGMQHCWKHPVFDAETPEITCVHEKWLRDFANTWNFNFDEMVESAVGYELSDIVEGFRYYKDHEQYVVIRDFGNFVSVSKAHEPDISAGQHTKQEIVDLLNLGDWNRYVTAIGKDLHSVEELGGESVVKEFWEHIEGYTKKGFSQLHKEKFGWSCSC